MADKLMERVHIGTGNSEYFVDVEGNIYWRYRTNFRKLKGFISRNGYHKIQVGKTTHYVHRLVAQAFIPNTGDKPCVNHKDGNKLNNSILNLEWVTHSENMRHAFDSGIYVSRKGSKHPNAKLTERDVAAIKLALSRGISGTKIAGIYGVSHGRIYDIKHGRSWTHVASGLEDKE